MKSLFPIPNPTHLYYCEKPLPLAKPSEIQYLPVSEVTALIAARRNCPGFRWSSEVMVPDNWKLAREELAVIKKIQKRLIPADKLVICFINEEVGYGVFAREKIEKGSILFYGGEIVPRRRKRDSFYAYSIDQNWEQDALNTSAHSSLLQDLYPAEIEISPALAQLATIAKNNFEALTLFFPLSQGGICYLEATDTIAAGSQCGQDYGVEYWKRAHKKSGVIKQYFTVSGNSLAGFNEDVHFRALTLGLVELMAAKYQLDLSKLSAKHWIKAYTPLFPKLSYAISEWQLSAETIKSFNTNMKHDPEYPFFAPQQPFDILLKYQISKFSQADIAFRRAAMAGNVNDMRIIAATYPVDLNAASENGKTAMDWAVKLKLDNVIAYLTELNMKKLTIAVEPVGSILQPGMFHANDRLRNVAEQVNVASSKNSSGRDKKLGIK